MSNWQPIDTAPKDGRRVLLCNLPVSWIYVGHWDDDEECGQCWRDDDHERADPTHWQPLPEAPST